MAAPDEDGHGDGAEFCLYDTRVVRAEDAAPDALSLALDSVDNAKVPHTLPLPDAFPDSLPLLRDTCLFTHIISSIAHQTLSPLLPHCQGTGSPASSSTDALLALFRPPPGVVPIHIGARTGLPTAAAWQPPASVPRHALTPPLLVLRGQSATAAATPAAPRQLVRGDSINAADEGSSYEELAQMIDRTKLTLRVMRSRAESVVAQQQQQNESE